jgi:hypothetical protein
VGRQWKKLTPDEAKAHPLYGLQGWLLVFISAVILGCLREVWVVMSEARAAGVTLAELLGVDHPLMSFTKSMLLMNFASVAIICWALVAKHTYFRFIASGLLLASWPMTVAIGVAFPFPGLGKVIAVNFLGWLIVCGFFVSYLNLSRRVRVTFEHKISERKPATAIATSASALVAAKERVLEQTEQAQENQNRGIVKTLRVAAEPIQSPKSLLSGDETVSSQAAHLNNWPMSDSSTGIMKWSEAETLGEEADAIQDEAWNTALVYYPDLPALEQRLRKTSKRNAIDFKRYLIERQAFESREEVAKMLEDAFMQRYFGSNSEVQAFAQELVENKNQAALKSLNEGLRVVGSNADPQRVISTVKKLHGIQGDEVSSETLQFVRTHRTWGYDESTISHLLRKQGLTVAQCERAIAEERST